MELELQKGKISVDKKYVILCEGRDEERFIRKYLKSEAVAGYPSLSDNIQIINFGGNDELPGRLKLLKVTPGFEQVEALLIIRDAEKNATIATNQIKRSLENSGLPKPAGPGVWVEGTPNVGFLLFPVCSNEPVSGALEDLCLLVLKEPEKADILDQIKEFLQVLKQKGLRDGYPHEFKTKLHTYFSVTDKYVGSKIGEAADAGAFDWNSIYLEPLKNFIVEKMV